MQNLLSDDNESTNSNDEVNGMESEGDVSQNNSSYKSGIPRKVKVEIIVMWVVYFLLFDTGIGFLHGYLKKKSKSL